MSLYLDTSGETTYTIGLCARCSKKFPLSQLLVDPNSPGLRVCRADVDQYDPYRLAARAAERVTPDFVRPDEPLTP
jgi:hypothetical protein